MCEAGVCVGPCEPRASGAYQCPIEGYEHLECCQTPAGGPGEYCQPFCFH
jgi:hypothetical protein